MVYYDSSVRLVDYFNMYFRGNGSLGILYFTILLYTFKLVYHAPESWVKKEIRETACK